MLNKFTLFLLLFTVWFTLSFFSNNLSIPVIVYGAIASIIIVMFIFKTGIMTNSTEFKFLQFNFYAYILQQLNTKMDLILEGFKFINDNKS